MRTIAFCFIVLLALTAPFPLFLFCASLYIFFWNGFELLFVTAFVDAFFGMTTLPVLYTLSVGGILILGELIRPYASWYAPRT